MQHGLNQTDFDQNPFITIWETTRACPLHCKHCRAQAQLTPLPGELSFNQAKTMLRQIADMGCKIMVLSGGDPLRRQDLYELIHFTKMLGMRAATIPAASDDLNNEKILKLHEAGVDQLAFSLDYPNAKLHDEFRDAKGAFEKTMQSAAYARKLSIPLQINTTITAQSLPYLKEMGRLIESMGVSFWEVFFLIPMGRGESLTHLSPALTEQAFEILYDIHQRNAFVIKVTEAPHYRRYFVTQEGAKQHQHKLTQAHGPHGGMGLAPRAVGSGNGFMFIAYNGDIYPSGFLEKKAGNVLVDELCDIYRHHPVFKDLRDPSKLKGKCGVCEFKAFCGGSRSRAFATTGDYLSEEPWCAHEPAKSQPTLPMQ